MFSSGKIINDDDYAKSSPFSSSLQPLTCLFSRATTFHSMTSKPIIANITSTVHLSTETKYAAIGKSHMLLYPSCAYKYIKNIIVLMEQDISNMLYFLASVGPALVSMYLHINTYT